MSCSCFPLLLQLVEIMFISCILKYGLHFKILYYRKYCCVSYHWNLGWACLTMRQRIIELHVCFGEHHRIKWSALQKLGKWKANISLVHTQIKDKKQGINNGWILCLFWFNVLEVMHFKGPEDPVCDLVLSQICSSWLTAFIFRKAFISVLLWKGHFEVRP